MRFTLTISVDNAAHGNILPLSYAYELSAWIYKVLASSDTEYATWLHNNGFLIEGKRFKFFTFSQLFFDNAKGVEETDRLAIFGNKAQLFLSFLPEKSTKEFIKGIFLDNIFTLGDRKSKVKFKVESVELHPSLNFNNSSGRFRTISPIAITTKTDERKIKYVSPEDSNYNYGQMLINNLKEKYRIYHGQDFTGKQEYKFNLLSAPRSRLIRIKADTPAETRMRGFFYDFQLKAPPELLSLMYESGAGEKNSIGFGMVKPLEI